MSDFLTLREAADLLGVHYMTAYRYVRLGLLSARKRGRTWQVSHDDLLLFQQGKGNESSRSLSTRTAPWFERYESRLLAGDQTGAWKVLETAMTSGLTQARVYEEVFVPALTSIGIRWETDEIGVEAEHVASRIVGRHLGQMSPLFVRRGRRLGTVVVTSPPGESHGFGLAMVTDILRLAGYVAIDLGPDTPIEALERVIENEERIVALCIGVLDTSALPAARTMAHDARRLLDRSTPIILGGGAVDVAEVRSMGADYLADLSTVVEAVERGVTVSDIVVV